MANLKIEQLKPQVGVLKIKHPVLTNDIVIEGTSYNKEDYQEGTVFDVDYVNEKVTVKQPIYEFDLPDGTKGPLEFYVVGRNSKQWYEFMKVLKASGKADKAELFNIISDQAPAFMASLITGWTDNGAIDTPYSPEEAASLISNPENLWILEQIQAFVIQERNFFLKI